jgi:hypothetical protein
MQGGGSPLPCGVALFYNEWVVRSMDFRDDTGNLFIYLFISH